jgi:hypothetical protein
MRTLFNWEPGASAIACGAGDDLVLHTMQLVYVLSIC